MTEFETYKDDDTGLYVARHPELPVSSCGDTEEEALQNAREAVELYEKPSGEDTPDYEIDEDDGGSRDKQIHHIVADIIGDVRYCPACDSKLEIEWDEDERGDRRCPDCERRFMEYNIEYLVETEEMQSREELMEQEDTTEILKKDTVEYDEDIDVMRVGVDLRMERMSDKSVFIAGYGGGDDGDIDYRYFFTVTDEGGLRIDREIIRDKDD